MRTVRPITTAAGIVAAVMLVSSCKGFIEKSAVETTSGVLFKAQGALKQESDYEHAARALPGALKTIEGFHYAYPEFWKLTAMLAEGYCQYGTGFTEDEWEDANLVRKDFDQAEYILSLIHISEPTRLPSISYAVF